LEFPLAPSASLSPRLWRGSPARALWSPGPAAWKVPHPMSDCAVRLVGVRDGDAPMQVLQCWPQGVLQAGVASPSTGERMIGNAAPLLGTRPSLHFSTDASFFKTICCCPASGMHFEGMEKGRGPRPWCPPPPPPPPPPGPPGRGMIQTDFFLFFSQHLRPAPSHSPIWRFLVGVRLLCPVRRYAINALPYWGSSGVLYVSGLEGSKLEVVCFIFNIVLHRATVEACRGYITSGVPCRLTIIASPSRYDASHTLLCATHMQTPPSPKHARPTRARLCGKVWRCHSSRCSVCRAKILAVPDPVGTHPTWAWPPVCQSTPVSQNQAFVMSVTP